MYLTIINFKLFIIALFYDFRRNAFVQQQIKMLEDFASDMNVNVKEFKTEDFTGKEVDKRMNNFFHENLLELFKQLRIKTNGQSRTSQQSRKKLKINKAKN